MKKYYIFILLFLFILVGCDSKFSVRFVDESGNTLSMEEVKKGEDATPPELEEKIGYDFVSWDKDYKNVQKDLVIKPIFKQKEYNVDFYNFDGEIIKTEIVKHGENATSPTNMDIPGYEFSGWDISFTNVTSDLVVIALYNKLNYVVRFLDFDGTELKKISVEYGKAAVEPVRPTRVGFLFKEWDKDFSNITSNLDIRAVYEVEKFKVQFLNSNNELIKEEIVEYGKDATAPEVPEKLGHSFVSWSQEYSNVVEHLVIVPIYNKNLYTINFVDMDDEILSVQKVYYGSSAIAPSDPTKDGYEFVNWDKDFTTISEDTIVKAVYKEIEYKLIFNLNSNLSATKWESKDEFLNEFYTDLFNWMDQNISKINGLSKNGTTFTFFKSSKTAIWSNVSELRNLDQYDVERTIGTIIFKPFTRSVNEPVELEIDSNYFLNSEVYLVKYADLDRYFLNVMNTSYTTYNKGYNATSDGRVQIFFRFQQWNKGTSIPAFDSLPVKYTSNMGNAEIIIPQTKVFTVNEEFIIENPVYSGITFLGWFIDEFGSGNKLTKINKGTTNNIQLFAKWDNDTTKHHVLFLDYDKTILQEMLITDGESITAPNPNGKEGFIFEGWDKDFMNINEDTTITALYGREKYTINYHANIDKEGVFLPTEPSIYTVDDAYILKEASLEGYVFAGWYMNPECSGNEIIKTTSGNLDLYARWVKIPDGSEPNDENIEVRATQTHIELNRSTNIFVYQNQNYLNTSEVKFISLNPDIANINEFGFVIGIKEGKATILVITDELSSTIEITVEDKDYEVLYVGHRGSGGPVVPNAVSAFELGGIRGYYALETDIRVSSDGVYYICHDDTFLPYLFVDSSLHNKLMGSYTWNQLKDLEIKATYNGVTYYDKLATVDEYLKICKKYNAKAVIELKWTNGINSNDQSKLDGLVDLVKANDMYENAIFMTSMKNCLTYLRNNYKDITLQFLSGASTTTTDNINWCIENRISLDCDNTKVTPEIVLKMHEAGLYVNAYTVNSNSVANSLINMGVDMITTDHLGVD